MGCAPRGGVLTIEAVGVRAQPRKGGRDQQRSGEDGLRDQRNALQPAAVKGHDTIGWLRLIDLVRYFQLAILQQLPQSHDLRLRY